MKFKYWLLSGLLVLLLVALLTNPNENTHKQAVKEKFRAFLKTNMEENKTPGNDNLSNLGKAFGMMMGGLVIDGLVNSSVTRENYLFFSITKIRYEHKVNGIGLGIFGKVFISDKVNGELEKKFGQPNRNEFELSPASPENN